MYLSYLLQVISKRLELLVCTEGVTAAALCYTGHRNLGRFSSDGKALFITEVSVPTVKAVENILGED